VPLVGTKTLRLSSFKGKLSASVLFWYSELQRTISNTSICKVSLPNYLFFVVIDFFVVSTLSELDHFCCLTQGFIRIRAKVLFFVEKFSRELIFTLELEV